jgi:hypothetical protein
VCPLALRLLRSRSITVHIAAHGRHVNVANTGIGRRFVVHLPTA